MGLYSPFVDRLVVELKYHLVIVNDWFKAQYLYPSICHDPTPQEDAIFDVTQCFSNFGGDRESFRREVSRW